jgi:uncharacterized protein YndB with AHSA1/START domain
MDKPAYVYVTYIKAPADKVWQALTDGEVTRKYWFHHRNASDWKVGSAWRHEEYDDPSIVDIVGKVVENDRPNRLVVSWASPKEALDPAKYSRVTYDIVEDRGVTRLTVTHDQLEAGSSMERGITSGWPMVLANLKTYLETGEALPPMKEREEGKWKNVRFG